MLNILKLSKYPLHPAFQFDATKDDERIFNYIWPGDSNGLYMIWRFTRRLLLKTHRPRTQGR